MSVAESDGVLPTGEQAQYQPDAPPAPFYTAFDGWNDLLESLPIENTYITSNAPLRKNLITDLQRVSNDINAVPRVKDIKEHGEYSYNYYKKEFGGIQNALETAGITKTQTNHGSKAKTDSDSTMHKNPSTPTRDELIEALTDLDSRIEGVPRTSDMNDQGSHSAATYYNEFDSWNDALAAAEIETDRSPRTTTDTDPKTELRNDLTQLADQLGRLPKTTDVKQHGTYSLGRYYNHYDSWQAALDDADLP